MKIPQSRCDDAHLRALINDELSGNRLEDMLLHIEECDRCRRRMDDLSAESRHWQRTVKALSDGPYDMRPAQSSSASSRYFVTGTSLLSPEASIKRYGSELLVKQLLSQPSHPEMLGRIGRYDVERLIGLGGMGVVFKAFDTELNRPVAIKVLAPHLATCGSARQRFAREARAAAAVVHEHVVPIHNVEIEGETPFLVMKYIDGESLQARLDREGPLEVDEILRIAMQVAAGLAAAHQQGLVHRDIKPANILLEQNIERALITDFGLARAVDDANLTHSGFHVGTPQYMSPEQVTGQPVDCSSDLFSLGSVLYAMCTGRPPFRSENSFGVMKRIAEDDPRSIGEINPRIPSWLVGIANRLLVKCPRQRLNSAMETSHLFSQCLQHLQNASSAPLPPVVVTWMIEGANSQVPSEGDHPIAKSIRFMLTKPTRLVAAALIFVAVGTLATFTIKDHNRVVSQAAQTGSSLIVPQDPSSVASDKQSLATQSAISQPADPELEWDAAILATRSLQRQAEELEQRIMRATESTSVIESVKASADEMPPERDVCFINDSDQTILFTVVSGANRFEKRLKPRTHSFVIMDVPMDDRVVLVQTLPNSDGITKAPMRVVNNQSLTGISAGRWNFCYVHSNSSKSLSADLLGWVCLDIVPLDWQATTVADFQKTKSELLASLKSTTETDSATQSFLKKNLRFASGQKEGN